MKLEAGDVILTGKSCQNITLRDNNTDVCNIFLGTPSGVGPIKAGDVITAGVKPGNAEKDTLTIKFNVADRKGLFKPTN